MVVSSWTAVATTPLTEVVRVERRINEYDGRRRFIEDRSVTAAVDPLAEGSETLAGTGNAT